MLDNIDIFTNKYADVQLFTSGHKEIERLFKTDIFDIDNLNIIVMHKKVLSIIQVFHLRFHDK